MLNSSKREMQRDVTITLKWNQTLSDWRLCSELNMIFIFNDNSDGDEVNANSWHHSSGEGQCMVVHHADFEPSVVLRCLTDALCLSDWKTVCRLLCPPTCILLSLCMFDLTFCPSYDSNIFMSPLSLFVYLLFPSLFTYRMPVLLC